jgi:hypothetical protein
MACGYYMIYTPWWQETISGWYGVGVLYVLYFMVAGNHTCMVWCADTICIILYGGRKPYYTGMVWEYYTIYTPWLQETILAWYGVQVLYILYFMVAGNYTTLLWCADTICIIFYGDGKPY